MERMCKNCMHQYAPRSSSSCMFCTLESLPGFKPKEQNDNENRVTDKEQRISSNLKMVLNTISAPRYDEASIEPAEYIASRKMTFFEGNIVKYVSRHTSKDGAKDIRKVIDYARMILADVYGEVE